MNYISIERVKFHAEFIIFSEIFNRIQTGIFYRKNDEWIYILF